MPRATAIIIGVSNGDSFDDYSLASLPHAEPAAERIAGYAQALKYDPVVKLIGPDATFDNVDGAFREAAKTEWDTVLVVFSGHGWQMNSGLRCESDYLDEHWCLYDQLMVDDHLLMLTKLLQTSRLFIVADCCYAAEGSGRSGDLARELRRHESDPLPDLFLLPDLWEDAVRTGRAKVREENATFNCLPPAFDVLLLAAAGREKAEEAVFMRAFLTAWEEGTPRKSFRHFYHRVVQLVTSETASTVRLVPSNSLLLTRPAFEP